MTPLEFLQRILPSVPSPDAFGYAPFYYSLALGQNTRQQKPAISQAGIVIECKRASNDGFDAYMALASFKDVTAGRKQANAHECRSIWADIDCGKSNSKYSNALEGFEALMRFCIPPSVVVSSGMGLHAYWCFTKNIPANLWLQVATFFKQLCTEQGLDVDPARATDLASVLRMPGTVHQKSGRTVTILPYEGPDYTPVDFLHQIGNKLSSVPAVPINLSRRRPVVAPADPMAALMGPGFTPSPSSADALAIARHCAQIRTMGTASYDPWFAAMSVLKRCVNGREWAHALSKKDPRYSTSDTDRRYDEALDDAPALCATFEEKNAAGCIGCPHRGTIKTPVQLTKMRTTVPPPVENPELELLVGGSPAMNLTPPPLARVGFNSSDWKVDDRGVVMLTVEKDANGQLSVKEQPICPVQIYFKYSAHSVTDGRHRHLHFFDAIYPGGKVRELKMIADEDKTEQGIMKWLAAADINPHGRGAYNGKVFVSFFNAYLNANMTTKKTLPIVKEFGWTKYPDPVTKREEEGFAISNGVITATGMHSAILESETTGIFDDLFTSAGSLDAWKDVPRMYATLGQNMGKFVMCTAFAAPFMRDGLGEAKNAYINIYSNDGGKGKSALARAAFSVWGDPAKAFRSPQSSMTNRSKSLTVFNNLPFIIDEITDMKDQDLRDMVYILANGMDKERSRSNASLTKTGNWSTFTMSTANRSVKEALSRVTGDSDATFLRVVEYQWPHENYDGFPEVQNYIKWCMDLRDANYGLAGPELIHRVLQTPVRLRRLKDTVQAWRIKYGLTDKERYLATLLAVSIEVGRWCVDYGLLDYDMDELERWAIQELLPFNREATAELSPDFPDAMAVFLNTLHPDTLIVRRDSRNQDEPDPGTPFGMPDKYVAYRPLREVQARYEQENEMLRVSSFAFREWCKTQNISPKVLLQNLEKYRVFIKQVRANLGRQVSYVNTGTIRCLEMDAAALRAMGFNPKLPSPPPLKRVSQANPIESLMKL